MGLRWQITEGLTLRASRSRNFRAPTLTQLVSPVSVAAGSIGDDPCDADNISSGPDPATRLANCQAEWAANPAYGDLSTFQDPAENFTVTQISSGGNSNLENEISDTWTFGLVLEPTFAEGLRLAVDRIEIDMTDGLSAFAPADFLATCYDVSPQPADICSTFTRLAVTDGTSPAGTINTALSTTFNAGVIKYEGETFFVDYELPLDGLFSGNAGDLLLSVESTHTSLLTTSVTGSTFVRSDNTVAQPDWVTRFNARYRNGALGLTYQMNYLSEVKAAPDATIENNPNPIIDSNMTHSISAHYEFGDFTVRAGVNNFTNEAPSYPNFAHGDILGRRWFVGLTARFWD